MALYGSKERYTLGAIRNANLLPQFFPGWKLRVYMEAPDKNEKTHLEIVPQRIVNALRRQGAEIAPVPRKLASKIPPSMWRYLVADDKNVEYFLVRDSNSRLCERDQLVVDAFVTSGEGFHCIRDHYRHSSDAVVGGLWGARSSLFRNMLDGSMSDLILDFLNAEFKRMLPNMATSEFTEMNNNKVENAFLQIIWRSVHTRAYCHDSVSCWKMEASHPFPVRSQQGEYLGRTYGPYGLPDPGRDPGHNHTRCTRPASGQEAKD